MAWNPGISYHGDQYLAQGLSKAGSNIWDAIDKFKKNKEEVEFLDAQFKNLATTAKDLGVLQGEDLEKFAGYHGKGVGAKRADVVELARRIDMKQKMEAADLHKQQVESQLAYYDQLQKKAAMDMAQSGRDLDFGRAVAVSGQAPAMADLSALLGGGQMPAPGQLANITQSMQQPGAMQQQPMDLASLSRISGATGASPQAMTAQRMLLPEVPKQLSPLEQYQADTERMRVEAYRKQIENQDKPKVESPLEQYKSETERLRAEAYRKQVEGMDRPKAEPVLTVKDRLVSLQKDLTNENANQRILNSAIQEATKKSQSARALEIQLLGSRAKAAALEHQIEVLRSGGAKTEQPADKKAEGGYKTGAVYGGLRYLGGDINDESNWEKVR